MLDIGETIFDDLDDPREGAYPGGTLETEAQSPARAEMDIVYALQVRLGTIRRGIVLKEKAQEDIDRELKSMRAKEASTVAELWELGRLPNSHQSLDDLRDLQQWPPPPPGSHPNEPIDPPPTIPLAA